jgi:hypothetical protein
MFMRLIEQLFTLQADNYTIGEYVQRVKTLGTFRRTNVVRSRTNRVAEEGTQGSVPFGLLPYLLDITT